jgi:triosephosphate isomerase
VKEIFVNLKRFDVPKDLGGVCSMNNPRLWVEWIVGESVKGGLGKLDGMEVTFLLPEGLVIPAVEKLSAYPAKETGTLHIGVQGVFREDVAKGVNFGAFTTNLPAAAAKNMGCTWSILGHSEERKDKLGILAAFEPAILENGDRMADASLTVNRLINKEVLCALRAGLNALVCVGETAQERGEGSFEQQKPRIGSVLRKQLATSLDGLDSATPEGRELLRHKVVIGYEPVWAIGPGKVPPGADYIAFVSATIKDLVRSQFHFDPVVVYGGGLKEENAAMISAIPTIGGGLVALTRFSGDIGFYPEDLQKIIQKYQETSVN